MNKGIFSSWFREFATLVLTQTVQAFLLAIVMSIIISCLGNANGNGVNAAGLLAIIALSSFGKIELLVKNIFGVTSGFGDPSLQGAKGFTAGTALAFRGISNLKDNVSKYREGKRMVEQGKLGMANMKANELAANNKPLSPTTPTDDPNKNIEDTKQDIHEQVVKLQTMGDIRELTEAIRGLKTATETANKTDTQSKMEKYQDMINQGQAAKKMAVRENIGAAIGGAAGAVVGLAQGDNVMQNALAGAGIGDQIGAASAKRSTDRKNYNAEMKKLNDKLEEFKTKEGKDGYDQMIKNLNQQLSQQGVATGSVANKVKVNVTNSLNNAPVVGKSSRETRATSSQLRKDIDKAQKMIDKQTNAGN